MLKTKYYTISLLLMSLLLVVSCVYQPESGALVDPRAINFKGYAENSSAIINIQAFNKNTLNWENVGTTISSTNSTTITSSTLYAWSRQLDLTAVPNWECYVDAICLHPAGDGSAKFRVKETGSQLPELITFDQGGQACVINKLGSGFEWLPAGFECKGANSPELWVYWIG